MFVQMMVRRYPEKMFHLQANPKFCANLKSEPNLHINSKSKALIYRVMQKINPQRLNKIYGREMARSDAVIRIGGSIFIERADSVDKFFSETNKNLFIMGANFGPYRTQTFFDTRKQRLQCAADCCFRDRYSYQLFSDILTVRYAPDILFGYPYLPAPVTGDHIGISVIDFTGRNATAELQKQYEKGLANICDYWTGSGKTVVLLGFCELEGDGNASDRVLAACRNKSLIRQVNYHGDIDAILDEMNHCNILYATRFHAMILGWTMQKKVVPLIYSEKQRHVIEDIDFKGVVWDLKEELNDRIICADTETLDAVLLNQLVSESMSHFSAFDGFVKMKDED